MRAHSCAWTRYGVVALVAVATSLAIHRSVQGPGEREPPDGSLAAPSKVALLDPDSLAEAADRIASGNLFSRDRAAPADRPTAPRSPIDAPPIASPVQRPVLVLHGIVGGPPWNAVIAGLPGRAGAVVVMQGDTIAGLTVRRIRADTVLIGGLDTTWTLTIAR